MTDNRQPSSGWRKKGSALSDQPVHHPVRLHPGTDGPGLVRGYWRPPAAGGWPPSLSAPICHSFWSPFFRRCLGGPVQQKGTHHRSGCPDCLRHLGYDPCASPHIPSGPALLGGLLVMSLLRSLGAGIQAPAVNAAIPQLDPEDQLMRYNGLNAAMQSLVNFAAPAAAGAVFAVSDLRTTLMMIDVVTAVMGTGLLSCLALPGQERGLGERSPLLADIRAGGELCFLPQAGGEAAGTIQAGHLFLRARGVSGGPLLSGGPLGRPIGILQRWSWPALVG